MKQKFKKGDKVRCISREEGFKIQLNEVYTVLDATDSCISIDVNGKRLVYYPERFELAEPFRIGDRVKLIDKTTDFGGNGYPTWRKDLTLGEIYTVRNADEKNLEVKLDSKNYWHPMGAFELVDRRKYKYNLEDKLKFLDYYATLSLNSSGYFWKFDSANFEVDNNGLIFEKLEIANCDFSEEVLEYDDGGDFPYMRNLKDVELLTDALLIECDAYKKVNSWKTPFTLKPGQEVTIAGIKGSVYANTGCCFISSPSSSNDNFFEKLFIDDKHKYVSSIVGYKSPKNNLFPEVKTIEDLTKVYLALKEREKELEKAPKYYKFIFNGYEPNFTDGKVYKIKNPLNLETFYNFIDNSGNPNGFSGINYKHFTPATEEEWEEQDYYWEVVEKPDMPEKSCVEEDDIITFKNTDTKLSVIMTSSEHWFCSSIDKDSNAYIFKALQIENKYKFIDDVIGYKGGRGDFPLLKSAEDLTKVINALKERDEQLSYKNLYEPLFPCLYWIPSEEDIKKIREEARIYVNAKALNIFDLSIDHIIVENPVVEHITDIFSLEV